MAALALVLVGAGLVHSMDETSTVFNTSSECPDSCICTWERDKPFERPYSPACSLLIYLAR